MLNQSTELAWEHGSMEKSTLNERFSQEWEATSFAATGEVPEDK